MTDYKELVEALRCKRDDCDGCDLAFFDKDEGWMCQYAAKDDNAAAAIEELQAQLPKRGKWIYKPKDAIEMMFTLPKCSVCGHESSDALNYCPNCGSLMRGEANERG